MRLGYNGGICVGCSVSICFALVLQTDLLLLTFTRPFKAFVDKLLIAVCVLPGLVVVITLEVLLHCNFLNSLISIFRTPVEGAICTDFVCTYCKIVLLCCAVYVCLCARQSFAGLFPIITPLLLWLRFYIKHCFCLSLFIFERWEGNTCGRERD